MIFSAVKSSSSESDQLSASLLRIVGLLLEGCALHAVPFDAEEHDSFRLAIRDIEERFERASDPRDLLILAGEANKTIQSYGASLEKYIRTLAKEKNLAIKLLAESLLRVCNTSAQTAQSLRQIEKELHTASQVDDMRVLRSQLAGIVDTLCQEAESQEQQYQELKARVADLTTQSAGPNDHVTGLPTLKHAEIRIKEAASSGHQAFVVAFFLKNVEVVNRRFGFDAGDTVLRRFAAHLGKNLPHGHQLFRWRGPCFVVVAERMGSPDTLKAEADRIAARGPDQEVESQGKSMLFRLTASTVVFPIAKNQDVSDISSKIDRFAAEQFKERSPGR